MGILFVGIVASTAISEALANKLFHGKEVPQPPQNAAEGQRGGTGEQHEESENEKAKSL